MPDEENTSWVAGFWNWLKGPGTVVIGFAVCLFVAGKIYGSDQTDTRNAIANHTTQLQASTVQAQTLTVSIVDLTRATNDVNRRQDVQQTAMIELIRAVLPLVRSAERRQRLQEALDRFRKVGRDSQGDFAGGDAYVSEKQ